MIRRPGDYQADESFSSLAIDLTPMIDVMFLLIIFFVLTSNSAQFALDINLPKPEQGQSVEVDASRQMVIALKTSPALWVVDEKEYGSWEEAKAVLSMNHALNEREIVIAGDKDLPLDRLINLLSYLETAGVQASKILIDPPAAP